MLAGVGLKNEVLNVASGSLDNEFLDEGEPVVVGVKS